MAFGLHLTPMTVETLIVLLFHAVLAPATALHALLYKRDSRAAFGWIVVCVLFPLAGPIIYLFFGLNRTRGRAQRMGLMWWAFGAERGGPLHAPDPIVAPTSVAIENQHTTDPSHPLRQAGRALSRHGLVDNNAIAMFEGGEATFKVMLEAIEKAQHHILIATYIFDRDEVGLAFAEALGRAVDRGVAVSVIIDGVGRLYSRPPITRVLQKAGVRVGLFLPPRLFPPSLSINMRSHHKIFLVDDAFAMTGGINLSRRHHIKDPKNPSPTNDLHFQLKGPVLAQLRMEFDRLWSMTTAYGDSLPPALAALNQPASADEQTAQASVQCRVVTDGPDEDLDRLTMLFIAALSQARHSVRIMTPYFLPPRELVSAIQGAAIRGIDVVLVLPSNNNLPFVHYATQNMLWELLFKGVRVFYQAPPFHHGKLLVIDEGYAIIGSSNWDARSLRLNFELQVEVYGEAFARQMHTLIDRAAKTGERVTLEQVDGRGLLTRIRDSICWLFSPYL